MDKYLSTIISTIKEDMDAHAHDAMNMPTPDLGKYCEIVGAYRGLKHALAIIDSVLRADEEKEANSN
jgi:hypothetical protein